MIKSQLISDIILRVSAGKPSNDLELEPKQIAFWIDQILNALVKQVLDQRVQNKEGIDGEYIFSELNLDVQTETQNGKAVYFIDLEFTPMNLYRDGGIIRVGASNDQNVVNNAKQTEIDVLRQLKFSKPSLKDITFTRIKSRLYLYGIASDSYQINNFDVYYVPKTKVLELLKDNDEIYVGEDLIPLIAEKVSAMAKDEILTQTGDLSNNAVDNNSLKQQ